MTFGFQMENQHLDKSVPSLSDHDGSVYLCMCEGGGGFLASGVGAFSTCAALVEYRNFAFPSISAPLCLQAVIEVDRHGNTRALTHCGGKTRKMNK